MADTKTTEKEASKKSASAKKDASRKETPQKKSGAKKTSEEKTPKIRAPEKETKPSPPVEKVHGVLAEVTENIEAGAGVVGEKVSGFAEKTAEAAGEVFRAVKKGLSTTYEAGSKVVDEITQTAQEYIGKYKHNMEVNKLSEERDKLTAKLGMITFVNYKMNKAAPQKLLEENEILELIKEIEKLDREIVKIGKELEKNKKTFNKTER